MAWGPAHRWWRAAPAGVLVGGGAYLAYMVVRETACWAVGGARDPWDMATFMFAAYFVITAAASVVAGLAFWQHRRWWPFWSILALLGVAGAAMFIRELNDNSHWGGAVGADFIELLAVSVFLLFAAVTGVSMVVHCVVARVFAKRAQLAARAGAGSGRGETA